MIFDARLVAGKHGNIYSECREKSGRELHARGRLAFCSKVIFMNQKVKISSKRCCRSRLKGGGSLRSDKSLFSCSLQINNKSNTSKFFCGLVVQVCKQMYKKNENCNSRLSFLMEGKHFSNLISKLFQLISLVCNSSKLQNVNKCRRYELGTHFLTVDGKSGKQVTAYIFFFF